MQASVNQVQATITELETAGEEQIDDISSLVIIQFLFAPLQTRHKFQPTLCKSNVFKYFLQEEVAQENQQKIEGEKQTVHKEKIELDKHRKIAEDIESEYSSVKERIDQLPEDMEPLKVQQSIVVSLCLEETN